MEFNYKNIIKEKNKRIRRILDICDRKDKEIERLTNELEREKSQVKEYGTRLIKAIEYIYLHSTQRKWFADISDRLHNQEILFKGRIEDLLDILKGSDKE